VKRRVGVPPYELTVSCWLERLTVSVGDWVAVTLPHFPSQWSGTRGLTSQIFEVWGRTVDLERGHVVLRLAQTGAQVTPTRYLAPACDVTAFADDTPSSGKSTLTVTQNSYTVADLRAHLQLAAGSLIAIDHWLDTKVEQMVKNQK
jgi:hypothetical protein